MTEHGPITHHGTGNISVGNSGTQTQGHRSPIHPPPAAAAATGRVGALTEDTPSTKPDRRRNVFVVHGRDEQAADAVFELLRTLDLVPLEWERIVAATHHAVPFLGDVVHRATEQAQAAVVLLTPDDVVSLHRNLHEPDEPSHETHETCQPRPNVLIELGMVLAAYPERTVIAQAGAIRPIADIAGRNFVRIDGSQKALWKLAERLKVAGCAVDDSGLQRLCLATFQEWDAYHRQP